jgi:hypothetical protein
LLGRKTGSILKSVGALTLPLAALALAALMGCGGLLPTPTPPPNTGIEGIVMLGPNCPVMQEGVPCPDTPYTDAVITVLDSNGHEVTQITAIDTAGHFRVSLAPGTYTLRPEPPPDNILPMAGEQVVTVAAGQYTSVEILYDTGIR